MTTAALSAAQITSRPLNTCYLRSHRRQPAAQPLLEIDLGLPAENLARPCDVRAPNLWIVGQVVRRRLERDLARRTGHTDHRLRELEHRQLVIGVADVHGEMLAGLRKRDETTNGVVDVAEAPRL